jgi:TIR domain
MVTKNDTVKNRKQKKNTLTIFMSYASEDAILAKGVQAELQKAFPFGVEVIVDTRAIKPGDDFKATIDRNLDRADILLILFTSQSKTSHSYTGYEVGFFNRSKADNRFITKGVERTIVPFCIGCGLPGTANYLNGLEINSSDVFKLFEDPTSFRRAGVKKLGEDNPVSRLLFRIAEIAKAVIGQGAEESAIRSNVQDSSERLYTVIFNYLQTRIYSESFPERKIIIRAGVLPNSLDEETVLSTASIELVGGSFELFGIILESNTKELTWSEFLSKIKPQELAPTWNEGIRLMVYSALRGDYDDNYHVVSTLKRDKAFRMFVSRVVTYYNGQIEVHVYIVEMKARDYGDQITTRLLKAISVGLKFRFLVLEDESPFTAEKLSYPTVNLKPKVNELIQQMNVIIRESRDLEDPEILKRIFGDQGPTKVGDNLRVWNAAIAKLFTASSELLGATESGYPIKKDAFLKALRSFADKTQYMNQEFTAKALTALEEEIAKSVSKYASIRAQVDQPAQAQRTRSANAKIASVATAPSPKESV